MLLTIVITIGLTGVFFASAYEITGHIGNDHDATLLEGASVKFVDATGAVIAEDDTDENGAFSITPIDAGTYDVYVYPPIPAGGPQTYSGFYFENFQVFEQNDYVGQWNLHYFTSSSIISGTLYHSSGASTIHDDVRVHLFDGEFFYHDLTSVGFYSIKTPSDGTYEMEVTGAVDHEYYYNPWLEVADGGTKNLVLASVPESAKITGTVTDSVYHTPYEGFWVVYESLTDSKYGPYTAETNSLGQYELYAYPNNLYDVTVYPSDEYIAYEANEQYTTSVPGDPQVKPYAIENPFPVTVNIDDGSTEENLYFADHTSSDTEGNYITLSSGDIHVNLPAPTEVDYEGPRDADHEYEGKMVYFNSAFEEKNVISPIETWELYYDPASVGVTFDGDNRLEGHVVDVRLLTATYNEVMDAVSDAKNGDTQPLKDLLAGYSQEFTRTLTVDGEFDPAVTFTGVTEGDYTVVIVKESFSPYQLYMYSAAPVEVLDYGITVNKENPVDPDDGFDLQVTLDSPTGTTYSYASMLIKEEVYNLYSEIYNDGTIDGSWIDLGHQGTAPEDMYRIAENGEILDIPYANYMDLLDYDFLNTELGNIYDTDEYSIGSALETDLTTNVDIGIDTDSNFEGSYILTTIVWEHDTGKRIVAFAQETVSMGQATLTIDSTNLPQPFSREVDVDYTIESTSAVTDAEVHVRVDVDGNIDVYTETVTLDLVSGTNTETYTLDTLAYIDGALARSGAAITITLELWHPIDGYITEDEVTDQLTQTSKDIMWERVLDVVGQWPFIDRTQKDWLWDNLILNVVGNWPFVPRAVP